jgi:basic membrane lipoprotein Med (substrate-binding protein (PBP1-ABC) superfamily)
MAGCRWPRLGLTLAVALAAAAPRAAAAPETFKVGFIYQGPRVDAGWYQSQDEGRAYLQKALPEVQVIVAENVPENADAERVMERMARAGARLIFATSYGYFDKAVRVAQRFPSVVFMHSGDGQIGYHVGNYFGSTEQAMYVAGVAAGLKTATGKLGYVAAHPLPALLRSINSFARGARSVNPRAMVRVIFLDSWKDPVREAEAANSLIDQGVDVLAQEVDSNLTMAQVAESRGIAFVGQYFDASAVAPHSWLVGNYYYWGPMMVDIVHQVQDGTWTARPILATLAGGQLRMTPGGPGVTPAVQAQLDEVRRDFTERGRKLWAGPIRGQDGSIIVAAGEVLAEERLTNMNFFVEGVVGSLPR